MLNYLSSRLESVNNGFTQHMLSLISWTGTATLLGQPDSQFWVMCGILATGLVQIVMYILKGKQEAKRREWDRQDREAHSQELKTEVKKVADIASGTKTEIKQDIARNTILTQQSRDLNQAALTAADNFNKKLATLQEGTEKAKILGVDTNDVAHRIEEKL